jgi:hypothetical protein
MRSLTELVSGLDEPIFVHDADGPGECLVRPGELVVPSDQAEAAQDALRRWVDSAVDHEHFAALRLRPIEREQCVRISGEHAREQVAPNHVHVGCPALYGLRSPMARVPSPRRSASMRSRNPRRPPGRPS